MDAFSAGRLTRTLDPVHSVAYFLPAATERFGALGMQGRTSYFAMRSAPMGAVVAGVAAATFYNFNPELVAASIPAAWQMAPPETVTRIRYEIVELTTAGLQLRAEVEDVTDRLAFGERSPTTRWLSSSGSRFRRVRPCWTLACSRRAHLEPGTANIDDYSVSSSSCVTELTPSTIASARVTRSTPVPETVIATVTSPGSAGAASAPPDARSVTTDVTCQPCLSQALRSCRRTPRSSW
jgi:hypothetical protein